MFPDLGPVRIMKVSLSLITLFAALSTVSAVPPPNGGGGGGHGDGHGDGHGHGKPMVNSVCDISANSSAQYLTTA